MPETVHIEITKPTAWLARGHTYPSTTHQWRALYRKRRELGLERAFIKIGGRIIVDEAKYLTAVRAHAANERSQ